MSNLLTPDDLAEVTGRKLKSQQLEVLEDWGIPFRVRPNGTVMTTWEAVNASLTGTARTRPNIAAARKAA